MMSYYCGEGVRVRFPHPMFRRNALAGQLKSIVICDAFKEYPEEHEDELRDMFGFYPPNIFGTHQVHNDLRILRKEEKLR